MSGKLILVPTPIDEESPLELLAKSMIEAALLENREKTLILVEEAKAGRQRWLRFGLPREIIADFVLYNEHTRFELVPTLIKKLESGYTLFLLSDGGLPAFCDPGRELIHECHQKGIKVTSTPFPNSVALAFALSGIKRDDFYFAGFLPPKEPERTKRYDHLLEMKFPVILMDTPYRLGRVLEELTVLLHAHAINRKIFLALDLNSKSEELFWGYPKDLAIQLRDQKREFVLIC